MTLIYFMIVQMIYFNKIAKNPHSDVIYTSISEVYKYKNTKAVDYKNTIWR